MAPDRAAMLEAAKAELASREAKLPKRVAAGQITAADAERSLAAWRAIVALLEAPPAPVGGDGPGTGIPFHPCLGSTPAEAWVVLVQAANAAVEHRASKNVPAATALRHLRSLLIRSAINAGAALASFDNPARTGAEQAVA